MYKNKIQQKNIDIKFKKLNKIIIKQGYGTRSYFKLMLNRLKVMGSYLYLYPFGDVIKKNAN